MRPIPYIFAASLILWALNGCDYEPPEQYFVKLEIPERETVVIDLSIAGDTIVVTENTNLSLSGIGDFTNLASVDVYFDVALYKSAVSESGFDFSIEPYRTGYYKLDIILTMYSGSGSIADQQGLETYTITKSWIVYIDKEPAAKTFFKSIGPSDGTLLLTWEETDDDRFNYYRVRKYCNTALCDSFKVYDQHQTSINDLSFVGGAAKYRLDVVTKGKVASEPDERVYKSEWGLDVKFTWNDDQTAYGVWRKNPFYNNVKETLIGSEHRTDANDTTITRNYSDFTFGREDLLLFTVVSANEKSKVNYYNYLFKGERCHPRFFESKYNKLDGLYYSIHNDPITDTDTLYVFGEDKLQPKKATQLAAYPTYYNTFSTDGKTLYLLSGNPMKVVEWDVESQSVRKTYSWSVLGDGSNLTVSDDGKVLVADKVLDIETGEILFDGWMHIRAMAPDGSQIFIQGYRYIWNGTTFVNQNPRPFTSDPDYLRQYPGDTLVYINETPNKFNILNASASSVLFDYPLTGSFSSINYDPVSHHLNLDRGTVFDWVNIKTGASGSVPHVLYVSSANRYLICNRGFYFEVE